MDNSQKLDCQFRTNPDFTLPAHCLWFSQKCGLPVGNTPKVTKEICTHCKANLDLEEATLNDEPFKSLYLKSTLTKLPTTYRNSCRFKLPLIGEIKNYATQVRECVRFKHCTLMPSTEKHNCHYCQDYIETARVRGTLETLLPITARYGEPVRKWAISVQTAPRKYSTLSKCIKSLKANGWHHGLICSEPMNAVESISGWGVTFRRTKMGIFRNMWLALNELFVSYPDADAYMLLQDDMLAQGGLRGYLERFLWPHDGHHIVSLFAPKAINIPRHSWHSTTTYRGGPNALILSHEMMQLMLSNGPALIRYWLADRHTSFDDLGIFHWASSNNIPTYFPYPSLMEHNCLWSSHANGQLHDWIYSDVVENQAIEHWYITDGIGHSFDTLLQHKPSDNWIVLYPHDLPGIKTTLTPDIYLDKVCNSDWVITTMLPVGVKPSINLPKMLKSKFDYAEKWINPAFGTENGEVICNSIGPCISRISAAPFRTANHKPDFVEQLESQPLWMR